VDIIRGEGKRGNGGNMAEDGVEAIAELIMKDEFGMTDTIKEMVAVRIKVFATEAERRNGGCKKGNA
jgi:hypothetical protein